MKKYGFGWLYRDFFTSGNTFGHILYITTLGISPVRYGEYLKFIIYLKRGLLQLSVFLLDLLVPTLLSGVIHHQICAFDSHK